MKLQNKVAVVTGGNSGIGLATARVFRANGARVVIFGRSRRTLDQAVESLGGDVLPVQGDVRNLGDLERLFEQTVQRFGKIDILVANAGIAKFAPVEILSRHLFETNSVAPSLRECSSPSRKRCLTCAMARRSSWSAQPMGTSRAGLALRSKPRASRLCVLLRAPCPLNFFPATFASMCSARA